jgi:hypothetical protein
MEKCESDPVITSTWLWYIRVSSSETKDIEMQGLQARIKLYKQIKDQLRTELEVYNKQERKELAKIISDSL